MKRLLALVLLLLALPAAADEFRPAYLQLTQTAPDRYDVLWKLPARNAETRLKVHPLFPKVVITTAPATSRYANGMVIERWRIAVPGGLDGKAITFTDLPTGRIDILVRLARSDGTVQLERILPAAPTFVVTASPGPFEVVRTYVLLGIEHILTGFDHLLFVLALVMLVKGARRLLLTVTAFTLAHSITLALATLGIIHVPGPPVEAMIALSIVFVAVEIVQGQRGRAGLAAEKPWLVAFSFGLLHGLGFAGALAEVGLPANSIPLALLFFNVGVEIGQLLFIAAVLALVRLARRMFGDRIDIRAAATVPAYAIGGVASNWLIERVASFWG